MTIFTIGYEGLSIDQFLALLQANGIQKVVDIRELPLSRKPGFSKKALHHAVESVGMSYVHIAALGCPRPVRNQYRVDGSWKVYTKGFIKHLNAQQHEVAALAGLAKESSCALLCYEADYNFCHRSMVANAVQEFAGARVVHLSAETKTKAVVASRRARA